MRENGGENSVHDHLSTLKNHHAEILTDVLVSCTYLKERKSRLIRMYQDCMGRISLDATERTTRFFGAYINTQD